MYGTFAWRMKTGFDITTNIKLALLGCFASLVWISAVPNLPVAHELMHRRGAFERFLANIAATFFFDPHRAIGHVHTHHLHFDTENDSDTPQVKSAINSSGVQPMALIWTPLSWENVVYR